MFTLTDTPVKFIGLLLLFSFATIWSLYQLARRQTGLTRVSNLAHLAMSVVMLLMVARTLWRPFAAAVPLPVLIGLFGTCVLWFGYLGVRGLGAAADLRRHGWHALGHAGMFGAMTWHLAAMLGHSMGGEHHASAGAAGQAAVAHGTSGHGMGGHGMGGQGMGGHGAGVHDTGGHGATTIGGSGQPALSHDPVSMQGAGAADPAMLIAIIGLPFMTYLLLAAIWNLMSAVSPGPGIQDRAGHEAAGHGQYAAGNPRIGALADFAMNFGMFWMSTGLLVALIPVFQQFAF